MRLFIALNFSDSEQHAITQIQHQLKDQCISGNFTRRENLHLTLAFLGEVPLERIPTLQKILIKTAEKTTAFSTTCDQLGCFSGTGQEMLWYLSGDTPPELAALVNTLHNYLKKAGFSLEDREFLPHVTLGRRCVSETVPKIEFFPVTAAFSSMELMLSEQIDRVLTYTPIFSAKFKR